MKKLVFSGIAAIALGTTAFAADMNVPIKAPPPMVMPPPPYNWNGFYIGGHVGWAWGHHDIDSYNYNTGVLVNTLGFDANGVFGGGQIGYNFVFAPNWLLGFEFDGSATGISTNPTGCDALGCSAGHFVDNDFGTGRARLGYIAGPTLFYGTGGWAWNETHNSRTITCVGTTCPGTSPLVGQVASASGFENGWSAGGGIEWGFAPGWSAKVEYLHLQFDNVTRDFLYTPATASRHEVSNNSIDTVRIGVNFHFLPFGLMR